MDKPLAEDIAQQVVAGMPMHTRVEPRTLPGVHLSLFWGLLRLDFNMPEAGGLSIIGLGEE